MSPVLILNELVEGIDIGLHRGNDDVGVGALPVDNTPVLLQAYRKSRDMVPEAGDRMATHKGGTGDVLWNKKISYGGPCLLYDDKIITQESAYGLFTGEQITRKHPLTGEAIAYR